MFFNHAVLILKNEQMKNETCLKHNKLCCTAPIAHTTDVTQILFSVILNTTEVWA